MFRVPPPASVKDPAEEWIRSFEPPPSVPPKVRSPVPDPATVTVAARVAGADRTKLPASATVIVGFAPVELSGLPARVTVPAELLTAKVLRSNAVPAAPRSLVAV